VQTGDGVVRSGAGVADLSNYAAVVEESVRSGDRLVIFHLVLSVESRPFCVHSCALVGDWT